MKNLVELKVVPGLYYFIWPTRMQIACYSIFSHPERDFCKFDFTHYFRYAKSFLFTYIQTLKKIATGWIFANICIFDSNQKPYEFRYSHRNRSEEQIIAGQ